jgi:hypothetical protein
MDNHLCLCTNRVAFCSSRKSSRRGTSSALTAFTSFFRRRARSALARAYDAARLNISVNARFDRGGD